MTLSEDEQRAISLFTFWWGCCEAGAELDENRPMDDESLALHYSGNGASCMLFVRDLRAIDRVLKRVTDDDQADSAVMAAHLEAWYARLPDPVHLGYFGVAEAAWKAAYVAGYLQRGHDEISAERDTDEGTP